MGAVRVEPYFVGRERNGLIGRFSRDRVSPDREKDAMSEREPKAALKLRTSVNLKAIPPREPKLNPALPAVSDMAPYSARHATMAHRISCSVAKKEAIAPCVDAVRTVRQAFKCKR
jgi:hypothetical protein